MLSLPLLLLCSLEICLRTFNYDGNLDVFIEGPEGHNGFIRCNPNVARRYFSTQMINLPTPPKQLFLKQKPKNGYRIFVLGESSAAGFPFGNNASFPNILERGLSNAFPEKKIEVINIALSAINSYTLLDMFGEVLNQSPDAILIYTGHNEYYGALGVGSVQSLGKSPWLVRTYLKLQSFKIFLLMRDFISLTKSEISEIFFGGKDSDPSATLMERIVAEQTISYGSSLYEAGKKQFEENMEAILQEAREHQVPVILGELVSNLRDQEPFISVADKDGQSAKSFFGLARQQDQRGEFENARQNYIKAKDLDALRFRASEDFNLILRELSRKYSVPLVPTLSYFEKESPDGIPGNTLFLEHLHPNMKGYFLLAKAFYETMQNNGMISTKWPGDCISQEIGRGITELDSVYSELSIRQLKGSWPFQPKSLPNRFLNSYHPSNRLEEIAFHAIIGKNFSIESAHMALGEYYENLGNYEKAFLEYNALIISIPNEIEFYKKATKVLLAQKDYDKALSLLNKYLMYGEDDFSYKWIGQIELMKNNYKDAIVFLKKANLRDPQVLFNLSRAYYFDNQWDNGQEYFRILQNISPRSEFIPYLNNLSMTEQKERDSSKAH